MANPQILTSDDLDELGHDAHHNGDSQAIVAQLVAAVDEDHIAELADHAYALTLASEITDSVGDLEGAIALARRAVASAELHGSDGLAETQLAELLLRAGRAEEGLATLTLLRPRLTTDPLLPSMVAETLELNGLAEVAVEWLTEALASAIALEAGLVENDPELTRTTQVVFELATVRSRVRDELGLDLDEYDELAEDLEDALDALDEPGPLIFWPQEDFEFLTSSWPALATEWEASWDEHRAFMEADLQRWWGAGHTDLLVLRGSVQGLSAFALTQELPDLDSDVEQDYLQHLSDSDANRIEWPPARNGVCWCGSGAKYKKCCLPRGRG